MSLQKPAVRAGEMAQESAGPGFDPQNPHFKKLDVVICAYNLIIGEVETGSFLWGLNNA